MIQTKNLEVKQGKGKDAVVMGTVATPQIALSDLMTIQSLLDDISELNKEMTANEIASRLNYGIAVAYRSNLHRPESKTKLAMKNQSLTIAKSLINMGIMELDEIAEATGIAIEELEKLKG